jgi:ABC-type lipoprotein export system ATPase subunit
MVGLSHRETHKPGELSGGEQQRVAIARALINKPKILVADEPTGNLDAKTGKEILDLMQKVSKEMHLTIIMATHNNEIAKLADRVVKISDGIIANE